jgi:hypothetical protein
MGEGYDAIQGGGVPEGWGGGADDSMTRSAGSVTIQSITFKYMIAFEPYMYCIPDIYNRSWQVCHTLRFTFFKHL